MEFVLILVFLRLLWVRFPEKMNNILFFCLRCEPGGSITSRSTILRYNKVLKQSSLSIEPLSNDETYEKLIQTSNLKMQHQISRVRFHIKDFKSVI